MESNEPNGILKGEHHVHVLTTRSRTGCQVVEVHLELGDPGPAEWRPCGLPVFAAAYCGWFDEETGDVEPVLCWRHLLVLGDTRDIVVRPIQTATLSPPASPVSASTGLSDSDRSGGRE